MPVLIALLVILAVPVGSRAQSPPAPQPAIPLPRLGLPLPTIGLPLAPIGIPQRPDPHAAPAPEIPQPEAPHPHRGGVVFLVPAIGWEHRSVASSSVPGAAPSSNLPAALERKSRTGILRLDVATGAGTQIYVDGYFVGAVEEVGTELELEEGPHRIELRAPGHEVLFVNVRIGAARTVTYRGALVREATASDDRPPALPTARSSTPQTIYLIPGCYMGNVHPRDARLPDTCDLARTTTLNP